MKNKLTDLNNHLFSQMERLSDEEIKKEDLKEEVGRAKAVTIVANQIINNARLILDARKAISDGYIRSEDQDPLLSMLGENKNI